jgi:transposase
MSKALSLDLRIRVLAAVENGASHRQAAERFGVSAASVSRWRARSRHEGDPRPKALGGDRRTGRIEAHRDAILGLVEATPDMTIHELGHSLARRGLHFGYGTLQRFLVRHRMTRKKRLAMRARRTGPTS